MPILPVDAADGSRRAGLSTTLGMALLCTLLLTAGCASRPVDRAELKREIKQEILAELGNTGEKEPGGREISEAEREQMKEELRGEILAEIQSERSAANKPPAGGSTPAPGRSVQTGVVRGRMLRDGNALENCRVKIVRMIPVPSFASFFVTYKERAGYEATTGADGSFTFSEVAAGRYRIKWQPDGETGWIRRLRDNPDFTVKGGETTSLDPIETHRAVVPR